MFKSTKDANLKKPFYKDFTTDQKKKHFIYANKSYQP